MDLFKYYNEALIKWELKESRPFLTYVLEQLEKNWNRKNIFVIEAPTGYGKTTLSASLSLYSLHDELKSIVIYPLRTLLEQQYLKYSKLLGKDSEALGKRYMHNPESRYLIKPITLTTIDTFSLTLFGIPPEDLDKVVRSSWSGTHAGSLGHYLFSWSSVILSNLVLDEVHLLADSTKSLNFLATLMKMVFDNGQKLVLMSATIPTSFKRRIKNFLEKDIDRTLFIDFEREHDTAFLEQRLDKKYDIKIEHFPNEKKYEGIIKFIRENVNVYSKVITVFNTVSDAVNFYESIMRDSVKDCFDQIILLHSRINEKDRQRKTALISNSRERYLIVSTQVIEAGVDISSNLFITEIAPANSLIQRLGRFLRYNENEGKILIWYDDELYSPRQDYKVYDKVLTSRTLEIFQKNLVNVHVPETVGCEKIGYKDVLDKVYEIENFTLEENEVNNLTKIFLNLEAASLKAVNEFFRLEGSFIREGLIIPVVPKKEIDDYLENNKLRITYHDLSKLIVPVSAKTFEKLEGSITNVIKFNKMENEDEEMVLEKFEKLNYYGDNRKIMRILFGSGILAFIVNIDYSEETGLLIGVKDDQ